MIKKNKKTGRPKLPAERLQKSRTIRASDPQWRAWKVSADRSQKSLLQWLRDLADADADVDADADADVDADAELAG